MSLHITAAEFFILAALGLTNVILAQRTGQFWMNGSLAQRNSRDANPRGFRRIQGSLIIFTIVITCLGIAEAMGLIGPDFKL